VFEIQQVFSDPRTGADFTTAYETHETKAAAVKSARKLKGRWIVVETRIVARSSVASEG
jgi:hypothetical protein